MSKLNKIVLIVFIISITQLYAQVSTDALKTQNKNQTDKEKADFLLNRGIGFYNLNNYTEALNDTYGHEAGDVVLKSIAELINTNIRKQDTVGRWGGEEFLILLPDTTLKGGTNIAEKLRQAVEKNIMIHSNYELNVTITFGVSMYNKIKDINECIKEADKALYVGKIRNKNCVVRADEV